jgi:hypothetical protein
MQKITSEQIKRMESQGLSREKIQELAQERGLSMPSASVGGLIGKAARFTGVEKLGQGLGFALFRFTPEYKNLEKMLNSGQITPEQWNELTTGNISSGEVLGSAARTAGNIAGAGIIGRAATPGTTAVGALGSGIKRGARVGATIGAATGGVAGFAEGVSGDGSISGIGSKTVSGAVGGGIIGGVLGGAGGALAGGGLGQGARVGAIEGLKGGAVVGSAQGMGEALEEDQDLTGVAAETIGGGIKGGVMGGLAGGALGGAVGGVSGMLAARAARRQEILTALKNQSETVSDVGQAVSRKASPYNIESVLNTVKKDKGFSNAVRDTALVPDDVAIVKASQSGDRQAFRDMLRIAKSDDINQVEKPIERAGTTFINRLKDLDVAKNQAGREIGEIAQTKLNREIPQIAQSVNGFADDLASQGVIVRGDKLDFTGSAFEDLPGVQRLFNTVWRRSTQLQNNGLQAHNLKRFIDEQVVYGKQVEGLSASAERVVKNLRRSIDQSLDLADPAYQAANQKYSTAITAQGKAQRLLGKDFSVADDFSDMRAGEVMNRVLGNASARPLQTLADVEAATKSLGYTYSDNVIAQIKFADMLEDITGSPTRSLAGQVERAGRRIGTMEDFVKKSVPFADDTGEFLRKAFSQTPEARLDALEAYINSLQ